jgi:hypothetical protein
MDHETTWDGGIIRYKRKDRDVRHPARMVKGERFFVSTRTHDKAAAMRHLRRFADARTTRSCAQNAPPKVPTMA